MIENCGKKPDKLGVWGAVLPAQRVIKMARQAMEPA
jgi:hypothetical protein